MRLVRNGSPIDPSRYTRKLRLGGGDFSDAIDPSKVAGLFDGGATVVTQSLHRTASPVRRFVDSLVDEVSHPVQANSYLTPPASQGLATHSDRHDVFVVQVNGSKVWEVDGFGETTLADGDVLYIPAGVEHSAQSTDESSLHLTIGIIRRTYRSVIERALRRDAPDLDRPLPLRLSGSASLADLIREHVGSAVDSLRGVDIDTLVDELHERERRRTDRANTPSVSRSVDVVSTGADDAIRRDSEWTLTLSDEHVAVVAGPRTVRMPRSCERALTQLDGGDPVRVDDLVGLDPASRIVVARRLLAAGLCHRVGPDPTD